LNFDRERVHHDMEEHGEAEFELAQVVAESLYLSRLNACSRHGVSVRVAPFTIDRSRSAGVA
jgi:hypothetical protein